MKRFIPFVFLLMCACKNEIPTVPKDVISEQKMKAILIEMHITDAVAETKGQAGYDERTLSLHYNEQIFKNFGTSREEFVKSYKFYEENPVLLNKMYDEILDSLSKREEVVGKK